MSVERVLIVSSLFVLLVNGAVDLKTLRYHEKVHVANIRDHATQGYANDVQLHIKGLGKEFPLKLYKNDHVLPKGFRFNHQDEEGEATPVWSDDMEQCYYHGYLQDRKRSSVVMSTCDDRIEGRINDDDGESYVIEPHPLNNDEEDQSSTTHIIYNTKDIMNDRDHFKDETTNTNADQPDLIDHPGDVSQYPGNVYLTPEEHQQYRLPTNRTKYIEIYPVLPKRTFIDRGNGDLDKARKWIVGVANVLDFFYKMVGARIVLVGIEIWNVKDKTNTLADFATWMKKDFGRKVHFDVAPFMDSQKGGGFQANGGMCHHPVTVNEAHSNVYTAAEIVAHEIGHSMGVGHDYNYTICKCPKKNWCIMNPVVNYWHRHEGWSTCSVARFKKIMEEDLYPCLDNLPGHWGSWYCSVQKCGIPGTRQRTKACMRPDGLCDPSKLIEKGGECSKSGKHSWKRSLQKLEDYSNYEGKKCARRAYKKKACIGNAQCMTPGPQLISWRSNIKWKSIRSFTDELVCACAKAARDQNIKHFGIFWWGLCFGMPESETDWVPTPGKCYKADESYTKGCPLDADYECQASDSHYFVYENTAFKGTS